MSVFWVFFELVFNNEGNEIKNLFHFQQRNLQTVQINVNELARF